MIGIALEGGGANGAYHMGAYRALLELGYTFDGFVGTSIGAVNASALAQGDFQQAEALWLSLDLNTLFDEDEKVLSTLKFDFGIVSNHRKSLRRILDKGGVDTTKMRAVLSTCINEDKLRAGGKDFGLVTVALYERRPVEIFVEDIPKGALMDYLMASSSFPGFQPAVIDDVMYIDGGVYNNCPINMLLAKGYETIIAVRTNAPGWFRKLPPHKATIITIAPRENLGNMMLFSPQRIRESIQLGYYDTYRTLRGLQGEQYYFFPLEEEVALQRLLQLPEEVVRQAGSLLGLADIPPKRLLFEQLIPQLATFCKMPRQFTYTDFVLGLLEYTASQVGLPRFQMYAPDKLCAQIKAQTLPMEGTSVLSPIVWNKSLVNRALTPLLQVLF